jgi:hypothetical protein
MMKALGALMAAPQNNLKIFKVCLFFLTVLSPSLQVISRLFPPKTGCCEGF